MFYALTVVISSFRLLPDTSLGILAHRTGENVTSRVLWLELFKHLMGRSRQWRLNVSQTF